MVQLGEDPGFNQKRLDILGASDSLRVRHLDSHRAVQVVVVSKIDRAEATLTEPMDDPISPNPGGISVEKSLELSIGGCESPVSDRLLVSSEERPKPGADGCEPAGSDGIVVSSIVRSPTTTVVFHCGQAKALSHPEPRLRSGAGRSPWRASCLFLLLVEKCLQRLANEVGPTFDTALSAEGWVNFV